MISYKSGHFQSCEERPGIATRLSSLDICFFNELLNYLHVFNLFVTIICLKIRKKHAILTATDCVSVVLYRFLHIAQKRKHPSVLGQRL